MKRFLIFLLFLIGSFTLFAEETILNYSSEIRINRDNTLLITESITVKAEGKKIKRGIYRTFPVEYRDMLGRKVKVRFSVQSVERNGEKIHYWVDKTPDGFIKVYMGAKNRYISPGIYTFKLSYLTDRQIGFFKNHDELYWNVTGQYWAFPIEKAKAIVYLPEGFGADSIIKWTAYTGKTGSREKSFKAYFNETGNLVFETTRKLFPNEGFTIVVALKKGIVIEPTTEEKLTYILKDNKSFFIGLLGTLILLFYYLLSWAKVGKDPAKGAIVPYFEPPENLSPAQMGYVYKMGYNDKLLISALVNMAIKGSLKIVEKNKVFSLERQSRETEKLSPEEKVLFDEWLKIGGYFKFKQSNHQKIRKGIKKFKKTLKKMLEGKYFYSNFSFFIPGLVITFLTFAAIVITSEIPFIAGFSLVWLSGWTFGTVSLWKAFLTEFKALKAGGGSFMNTLGMFLMSILFTAGEFGGMFMFLQGSSLYALITVLIIIILNIVFYYLLKAPTKYGRKVMDKIEGFKLYLSMAETDYIKFNLRFTKDVNTFKNFLPYAIALGVEQKWSEKFEGAIDKTAMEQHFQGNTFMSHGFAPSSFSSAMVSSMSKSIATSSNAPGSSSGFSGGGGAGGGGGGGGGGGF